jgi:hypothetical protein
MKLIKGPKRLKGDPIETSIQKDAKAFSASLLNLAKFCTKNFEAIVTKTVIDLFAKIVERTPVDTGRARANWALAMDVNSPEYADLTDAADWEYETEDGTTIWIYNNLVYIEALEEGHSEQAPIGMVAISLQEFTTFLTNAADKLSNVVEAK